MYFVIKNDYEILAVGMYSIILHFGLFFYRCGVPRTDTLARRHSTSVSSMIALSRVPLLQAATAVTILV